MPRKKNANACTPAVSVPMTTVDALAVGQQLRNLARDPHTAHGTREFFERVSAQMLAAARLAMTSGLLLIALLTGCAADSTSTGSFALTWSMGINSEHPTIVSCTETVSHPCPFLLYTNKLDVSDHLLWDAATGGRDSNGVPVEQHAPWIDDLVFNDDGSIVLAQRGDDGGLRRESRLVPTSTGYAGDITWTLFNVPGDTKFHVDAVAAVRS